MGRERKVKVKLLSRVQLFETPWTVAHQAPPSMGFSRQEYWSGLLFPSPGDLPDPGIEPRSPTLQADTLTSEPPGGNGNPLQCSCLEHPVDRGTWWAAVHGVAESQTRLRQLSMHACMGEESACQCSRRRLDPWVRKTP